MRNDDEPRRPSARATALVERYGAAEAALLAALAGGGGDVPTVREGRASVHDDLLAYLAALEAVRDFYADPAHYVWRPDDEFPGYATDVHTDRGDRARATRAVPS